MLSVVGGISRDRRAASRDHRRGGIGRAARQQRAVDEPAVRPDGDEIEHQRGHDLVDAEPRPQQRRGDTSTPPPRSTRPASAAGMSRSARPSREGEADDGRDEPAEIEAALDADIEHAGAKGDGRAEPGQQSAASRRRASPRSAASRRRPPRHQPIDLDRVVAGDQQDRPPRSAARPAANKRRADRAQPARPAPRRWRGPRRCSCRLAEHHAADRPRAAPRAAVRRPRPL